ncbi:hypothetical protein PIB30_088287 [Stylosanthes scabra]|uniref:Uncharacterized protein n=1 Tax=Stylosanthes scabra TaxID=79078 RepID=A0ABU6SVZ5_9FABA|nr:hypothetical protein [Stylosanthes scabra]
MSVFSLYLCSFILINIGHSLSFHQSHASCLPQNHKALFVFGDSLFDNGNNNYINTTTFLRSNFPPYGETFFKYPSGRFSDGRVISDFIAGYAKLPLIPPYLHPGFTHDQYIYGVNFASAGAGALVETNKGAVVDLKTQSFYFGQVSKQLRQELGEEEAKKFLSKAVYIFSIGGNDYAAPFYNANSSTAAIPYPQQQFVDFVIGNISSVIKDVYNEGGRKFGFLNVYPLGYIPLLRILVAGNSIEDCLQQEATVLARLQNNDLPKTLQKLEKELSGFKYSVTDNYAAFLDLIQNPSKYGLKVGSKACYGGSGYGGDYSCGGKRGIETYELCSNPNEYVFFDAAHPTDNTAHHISHIMWMGHPKLSHYNLKQLFEL